MTDRARDVELVINPELARLEREFHKSNERMRKLIEETLYTELEQAIASMAVLPRTRLGDFEVEHVR